MLAAGSAARRADLEALRRALVEASVRAEAAEALAEARLHELGRMRDAADAAAEAARLRALTEAEEVARRRTAHETTTAEVAREQAEQAAAVEAALEAAAAALATTEKDESEAEVFGERVRTVDASYAPGQHDEVEAAPARSSAEQLNKLSRAAIAEELVPALTPPTIEALLAACSLAADRARLRWRQSAPSVWSLVRSPSFDGKAGSV